MTTAEQEVKPKRKRRTPEEMAAARAAGEVPPKRIRKKKEPETQAVDAQGFEDLQPVTEKPPTQGVGVSGFAADVYAADEKKIDWPLLMVQPKFQMYCVELSRKHHGEVELWLGPFVQDELIKGEKVFFQAYCNWHDKKGYWKNEDYFGKLINEV